MKNVVWNFPLYFMNKRLNSIDMDNNKESFPLKMQPFLKYPVPLRSCRPGPQQAESEGSRLEKKTKFTKCSLYCGNVLSA